MYDIILVSLKAQLKPWSWFWLKTTRIPSNKFCKQLRCIAIDGAHLIWNWEDFQEKYQIIGHLKDIFPNISILILLATIISSVFEYICIFLTLSLLSCIYRQPLNQPNLTYMILSIKKPGFGDLTFAILSSGTVYNIFKTMIFVDSINDAVAMTKYLHLKLFQQMKTIGRLDQIIQIFSANLSTSTKT